jgi:hypothetical protein
MKNQKSQKKVSFYKHSLGHYHTYAEAAKRKAECEEMKEWLGEVLVGQESRKKNQWKKYCVYQLIPEKDKRKK